MFVVLLDYCVIPSWIHLLFTIVFHAIIMRDVEKHIGWFRIGIIYLGSGFAANIFSGTFIPYLPVVSVQMVMMNVLVNRNVSFLCKFRGRPGFTEIVRKLCVYLSIYLSIYLCLSVCTHVSENMKW